MTKLYKNTFEYLKVFSKWLVVAIIVGTLGGIIGVFFHFSVDYVTELRYEHKYLIYFLPFGGILIAFLYSLFRSRGNIDTNRVIDSIRKNEKIPVIMVPLIFVSTVITHMFGGSAGREGAALQIGGGIGYNFGKIFKYNENDLHLVTMAGMSSVFSALFGTPLTAAIFSIEVIRVGVLNYSGFLPCVIASITAFFISLKSGIEPMFYEQVVIDPLSVGNMVRVLILAALCAVVSILFCAALNYSHKYSEKLIKNSYIRAATGGLLIIALTLIVGHFDYNGAGVNVITRAINGEARYYDFILKITFTAITIAAGFKGGEIIPTLFIGSTFGCVIAPILGLSPSFGAAIGLISLFCGVVNCPIASVILSVEMFGAEGLVFFAVSCGVSYLLSGYFGLYRSQRIVYSKLNSEEINAKTI